MQRLSMRSNPLRSSLTDRL